MKNKGVLLLLEQTVMLLVFALAALACLRAFLWADTASRQLSARDEAMLQAQNAAEVFKHFRGDGAAAAGQMGGSWDGAAWEILYDESWQLTDEQPRYTLRVAPEKSEPAYLGQAEVTVSQSAAELAALNVCWQEVFPDE